MKPVIFSIKAESDLEAIADYIAQESPMHALAFVRELRQHCLEIGRFPSAYMRFPELGEEARAMPYKNYVVLYRVQQDAVSIERILHGARDILRLIREE